MNGTMSLYRLELRKHRKYFVSVLIVSLALLAAQTVVKIMQFINKNSLDPYSVFYISELLLDASLLSFPCMMLYSWYREQKDKTDYQMLSFPVPTHTAIRNKIKVFLSVGMVWVVLYAVDKVFIDWVNQYYNNNRTFDYPRVLIRYLFSFNNLLLMLGFVSLIIGVLQKIKRRRLLIGLGIVLICPPIYFWFFSRYTLFLEYILNIPLHTFTQTHQRLSLFMANTVYSIFPLFIGLACMFAGFKFFDRYSEV